jgi:hypothetical protein
MGGLASRWLRAAALLAITVAVAGGVGRFSQSHLSPVVVHVVSAVDRDNGR